MEPFDLNPDQSSRASDNTKEKNTSKDDILLAKERARSLESEYEEEELPKGFSFLNNSLMYKGKNQKTAKFICSKIRVVAYTRDDKNENHGLLLQFHDLDNHLHEWAMPAEMFAGDGKRYREVLLNMGLRIAPNPCAKNLLSTYLQTVKTSVRARCVHTMGWYKSSFILPDQVIGAPDDERIFLQSSTPTLPKHTCQGTSTEWQQNVAALCSDNSRLLFGVSAAFAPPLLALLGLENGGFHFRGSSSIGKTSLLCVSRSVWGSKDGILSWRGTSNGIEAVALEHNDMLLCLDELSQVDPDKAGQIAYLLLNGSGKLRADQHGLSKKNHKWRHMMLSTGEISLATHMNEAGQKIRAGQEVRIVDLPANTNKYGVFENLHGYSNGNDFSKAICKASHTYYGTAARHFLKRLVKELDTAVQFIEQLINDFMQAHVPPQSDGQVSRVARHFALVGACGELATYFGVTGWQKGEALAAAVQLYYDWLQNRGGIGSLEEQAILSSVRHYFEQNGESQFTPWKAGPEHKTIKRAGFRRTARGAVEFYVFPESFKSEVAKGYDPKLVASICLKHGLLRPGSKGEPTRSEKLPHMTTNARCYRFTSKVLGG